MDPLSPRTTLSTLSHYACASWAPLSLPIHFIQDEHLTHQGQSHFPGNLWLEIRFTNFICEAKANKLWNRTSQKNEPVVQPLWKRVCWFLTKLNRIVWWSSNSLLGYMPPKIKSRDLNRELYTSVPNSSVYNSQKEEKPTSINEWMDKPNVIYTCNEILALKKNEILTQATPWRNLEAIMLSEINQTQKDRYCMIPLTWCI